MWRNFLENTFGHVASSDPAAPSGAWDQFFAQFDAFFLLFCTAGLLFVILSQYVRHRRRQRALEAMQARWEDQRRRGVPRDMPLGYEAGILSAD